MPLPFFFLFLGGFGLQMLFEKNAKIIGSRQSKWERAVLYSYLRCFVTLWTELHPDSQRSLRFSVFCYYCISIRFRTFYFPRVFVFCVSTHSSYFNKKSDLLYRKRQSKRNRFFVVVFVWFSKFQIEPHVDSKDFLVVVFHVYVLGCDVLSATVFHSEGAFEKTWVTGVSEVSTYFLKWAKANNTELSPGSLLR